MYFSRLSTLLLVLLSTTTHAVVGDGYITEVPPTVYENETISPQNIDFDKKNNMFPAHDCWYNDKPVHYYKFRIFAPGTYPGVIAPGASGLDIPTQKVYMVTTTGGFDGLVGNPIIQYHHSDGLVYSDFQEIVFVKRGANYTENKFKSEQDVISSGATTNATGIMVNMPVVPTGATLQDPELKGTEKAPIDPIPVWYEGIEVWTYVFEVTDQSAADALAFTRPEDPDDFAYAISVVSTFAKPDFVSTIPIWHFNQYSHGVVEGENNGGPSPTGMRNVINLDRGDAGYSPLWQVFWMTALPINYMPDEATNAADLTPNNGFSFFVAPMFVNCPDIGNIGELKSSTGADMNFQTSIDPSMESNMLLGSHSSLIFTEGISITFKGGNDIIANTTTTTFGTYEHALMSSDIPEGTTEVIIMSENNVEPIATIKSKTMDSEEENDAMGGSEDAGTSGGFTHAIKVSLFSVGVTFFFVI